MAKLLTIIVLCVLGACVARAEVDKETIEKLLAIAETCRGETGASAADFEDLVSKKPPTTMEGKCMHSCIMKQVKVMDDAGKFVPAVALEHASKWTKDDPAKMKIANEIIDTCKALPVNSNHCEAAVELGNCLKEGAIAHGVKDFKI